MLVCISEKEILLVQLKACHVCCQAITKEIWQNIVNKQSNAMPIRFNTANYNKYNFQENTFPPFNIIIT